MAPFAWLLLAFPFSLADSCESNDCGATAPVDLLQRKLQVNNSLSLEGTRPNLLFIVLDQWRWDWTGLDAETPVPMPTLKRLAAQGVRFTRAYTPSPQCVPARSALAQVREYKDSWVKNNSELMIKQVSPNLTTTFMSALQDVGYTTMMAGKDHLFYNMYPMVPENEERESMKAIGFEHYHRTTDKYHFCLSDIGEDLGVLEDLGMSLEDLGMSNESFDGTGKGLLFPMDGYGVSLNETEGLFEKQCLYYGSVGYPDQQREGFSCGGTPVYDLLSITENGFRCQVSNPLDEDWSPDAWVRRKAVKLLQQHKQHGGSKPWFLQVNFLSPHPPFIVKPSSEQLMQELDGKLPPAIDDEKTTMLVFDDGGAKLLPYNKTYVNTSASRLQYAALLYQLDGEIKEILEAVSEMGAMDNTIVVVTGDHGEHLGDHGHFGKTSPFEAAAHVPLIVAGEGLPLKGVEEHRPVSLIDIPATFLDLAGAPLAPGMQGYSFLPALNGGAVTRPAVMFGIYYWETPFLAAGYTPGVIQFDAAAALFGDSFLKLICCPRGCRKAGTLLPSTMYGSPTVALMNVTAGTGKHQFEHDILNQPPGHGVAEALYLATFLADEFRQVCEPLLAPKA